MVDRGAPKGDRVHFVDATHWEDCEADFVLWTDASLCLGLAFIYAGCGFTYALRRDTSKEKIDIFFLELVAILSVVHHVGCFLHPPKRVLLWTDSLDSVAAYSSLRAAESIHNSVLLALAGILMETGMDLQICHIPGKENTRADLLSRLMIDEFHHRFPAERVCLVTPPRSSYRRDGGSAFELFGRASTPGGSPSSRARVA